MAWRRPAYYDAATGLLDQFDLRGVKQLYRAELPEKKAEAQRAVNELRRLVEMPVADDIEKQVAKWKLKVYGLRLTSLAFLLRSASVLGSFTRRMASANLLLVAGFSMPSR